MYSSTAFCCLAGSLHDRPGKAAQINFHVPSLQNTWFTGGKSIFAFDGLQAIFRGLELIQLGAALAVIHPSASTRRSGHNAAAHTLSSYSENQANTS